MTIGQLDLLDLNMNGLSVNDMVVKLGTVADLVEAHRGYQDKLPNEVPGPPEFRVLAVDLHQADQESTFKDRLKLAQRGAKFQDSVVALTIFGQFAVMKATKYKDTSYLDNLGFDRKKRNTGTNKATYQGPLGFPGTFSVKHGLASGSLLFKVGKIKGAALYEIFVCLGDPNDEGSWSLAASFLNTRQMQIDGLVLAKTYLFRMRALVSSGYGPWSNIVKIIVT
jgi:hypothetical protein